MIVLYVTTIKYLTRDTIYILFTKFKILYDTGTTKIFLYVLVKKNLKKAFSLISTFLTYMYILVKLLVGLKEKKIKMKFPQNLTSTVIQ